MRNLEEKNQKAWEDCINEIERWENMAFMLGNTIAKDTYAHCIEIVKHHMPKSAKRRKK